MIRLEDRVEASAEEYPYFQNKIARILQTEKQEKLWEEFLDSLKTVYPPTINDEMLAKLRGDSVRLVTEGFLQGRRSFATLQVLQACLVAYVICSLPYERRIGLIDERYA